MIIQLSKNPRCALTDGGHTYLSRHRLLELARLKSHLLFVHLTLVCILNLQFPATGLRCSLWQRLILRRTEYAISLRIFLREYLQSCPVDFSQALAIVQVVRSTRSFSQMAESFKSFVRSNSAFKPAVGLG